MMRSSSPIYEGQRRLRSRSTRGRRANCDPCVVRSDDRPVASKYFPPLVPSLVSLAVVLGVTTVVQNELDLETMRVYRSGVETLSKSLTDKLRSIDDRFDKMRRCRNRESNEVVSDSRSTDDGAIDWASSYNGGKIISSSSTSTDATQQDTSESTVIDPTNRNACWSFPGEGQLLIGLKLPVYVTHFAVEHFSRVATPSQDLTSAPKAIVVRGYRHSDDPSPHTFGAYEFDLNADPLQTFPVKTPINSKFEMIEFIFKTNHGHPSRTLVGKVGVYGILSMD